MAVAGAAGSVPAAEQAANPQAAGNQLIISSQGITAYDRESLQSRWQLLQGEQTDELVMAGGLLLATSSSGLYAIDTTAGRVVWKLPSDTRLFTPTVDAGTVYLAGEDGRLRALELQSGHPLWQRRFPGWVYPPAVQGDRLYTGGSDGRLWALKRTDGSHLWERSLGQQLVYRPVLTRQGSLITTNFNGEVQAFSKGGELLWRKRLPSVLLSPVEVDGRLIFSGLDNRLYALDGTSGETGWSLSLGDRLAAPLVVHQGSLLAGLDDGRVLEIGLADGQSRTLYRLDATPVASPYPLRQGTLMFLKTFGIPRAIILNRQPGNLPSKEI